jgi:hypothetical protein
MLDEALKAIDFSGLAKSQPCRDDKREEETAAGNRRFQTDKLLIIPLKHEF